MTVAIGIEGQAVGTPVHVAAQIAAQSGVAPGPAYVEAIAPSVNAAVNATWTNIDNLYYVYKGGYDTVFTNVIDDYFFSSRYTDAFKQEFCRKVRTCACEKESEVPCPHPAPARLASHFRFFSFFCLGEIRPSVSKSQIR